MIIRVDNREKKSWDILSAHAVKLTEQSIQLVCEPLEIGDYIIECDSCENTSPLAFAFERKHFCDLASSIKDGRYREQKARLLSAFPCHRITYILEDYPQKQIQGANSNHVLLGLQCSVYVGFVVNTLFRDGIHIHYTETTEETCSWLLQVAQRIQKNKTKFTNTNTNTNTTATTNEIQPVAYEDTCKIKTKKISNITPRVSFILQLGQVPGVSQKIAQAVALEFQSMARLIQELSSLESTALQMERLCKLPLVGNKKAQALLTYLGLVTCGSG
jgi:crossover junction endonuclease MUS81